MSDANDVTIIILNAVLEKLTVVYENGEVDTMSIKQVEPNDFDPPEVGSVVCAVVRGSCYKATVQDVITSEQVIPLACTSPVYGMYTCNIDTDI